MGRLATTQANALLDYMFGQTGSYTVPATYYIALSTTTPTDAGTNVTEPSGNAYARVAVTNNSTNFPAASSRAKSNGTAITFPVATGSWGTITHFAIYKHATSTSSSDFIGWGALTSSITVSLNGQPRFAATTLSISAPGT